MKKLTLELEAWDHKELKDYLLALLGVQKVNIQNLENLFISITYNEKLINANRIKLEIFLFLDIFRIPSLVSFDKHSKEITKKYTIQIKDLCCEFCLKGMIDDLFKVNGIEKGKSSFIDNPYQSKKNVKIYISYHPQIISLQEIKKLDAKWNE